MCRYYISSTRAQSVLSDDELDSAMLQILTHYPCLGHRMINGQLRYMGVSVPCSHIQASYSRVHVPPVAAFGMRHITRMASTTLFLEGFCKRYIMVPNGTGPRWDYVKDISWYQMELDLNGTMRACIGPYIYALQFPIYEAISMVYGHSSTPL
ncbi:hypothetical protein BDR07DRAFT_1377636 [Suillus spraguei]|nr:hypothetical protein BDR07DRAFT_1377636 [Suillus spraguei]